MNRLISVLTLGATLALCGCATTGYQRAAHTRAGIDEAQAVAGNIQHDLDAAVRALQKLTSQETTDLQPPYQAFAAAVTSLNDQIAKLMHRGQWIRKGGDTYAAAWQEDL